MASYFLAILDRNVNSQLMVTVIMYMEENVRSCKVCLLVCFKTKIQIENLNKFSKNFLKLFLR